MKRKITLVLIMIIACFFVNTNKVNAEETVNTIDFTKKGTISINLKDGENEFVKGAEISLYHIANAKEENHNLVFEYTEDLNGCTADLTNLKLDELTNEIINCVKEDTPSTKRTTNEEGNTQFSGLPLGLYLVSQTNIVEGFSVIDSFLVMIPKIENNKWNYNLTATPKTEIYKVMDVIVEKVWNTTSNRIPSSVTIELYDDTQLIDTVTLNKENKWTHTWERLPKSDSYTVKEIRIPSGYTATYRQVENKFIVTNSKKLAQTGQKLWIVETLAFLGIAFVAIGTICDKKDVYE